MKQLLTSVDLVIDFASVEQLVRSLIGSLDNIPILNTETGDVCDTEGMAHVTASRASPLGSRLCGCCRWPGIHSSSV